MVLLEHSCNKDSYQLIDIDYKVQIPLGYPQGKHTLKEKLRALQNSMNMGIWYIKLTIYKSVLILKIKFPNSLLYGRSILYSPFDLP